MRPLTRIGIPLTIAVAMAGAQPACYTDLTGAPPDRPYLSSLTPSTVVAGGPSFTLTIKGYGFLPADLVSWQGAPKAATFISSQEITAQIDASDIAQAQTVAVAVYRTGGVSPTYDQLGLFVKKPSP